MNNKSVQEVNSDMKPRLGFMIPLEQSKILLKEQNADWNILDETGEVYGRTLHGKGKIEYKNGNSYDGEFNMGMLHGYICFNWHSLLGKGTFTWVNRVIYEGTFEFNKLEGQGKYNWLDGSWYEGQIHNGYRHGFGEFHAPNDDAIYKGEWQNGLRHGKGTLICKNGQVYEGEFSKGYKHGQGKMVYPSKNVYEGAWEFDKKCGNGIMHWFNLQEKVSQIINYYKPKYDGNWAENKQNGFGTHIWLESKGEGKYLRNRYQGEWLNGLRHGCGVFYFANGSRYEGEWKNNLKHGFSIFINEEGKIVRAMFEKDKMSEKEDKTKLKQMLEEQEQLNQNASLKQLKESIENKALTLDEFKQNQSPEKGKEQPPQKTEQQNKDNKEIKNLQQIKEEKGDAKQVKKEVQQDTNKKETKQEITKKETKQEIPKKETKQELTKKETKQDLTKKETKQEITKKETKEELLKKETKEEIKESRDGKETKESKRQKSELAISEKSMIKDGGKSTASSRKKKQQLAPQDDKKKRDKEVVEPNPYFNLIDISDLLRFESDAYTIISNVNQMLLRHNVKLKQWYRIYQSIRVDEQYESEYSFAMNLQKFWAFLKDCKIMGSKVTIAAVDRLYYQGIKNKYNLTNKHKPMCNNILIQKKFFPVYQYTPEEYLFQEMLNKLTEGNETPFNLTPEFLNQTSNIYEEYFDCPQDIHNPSTIILFRQFAEILVRTAYLKYCATANVANNMAELHRGLEKLILKITAAIENKGKNREQSQNQSGVSQELRVGKGEEVYLFIILIK